MSIAPTRAGKTFCFNTLLADTRAKGHIALSVASSGIAALLLDLGRTFHSRFKASLEPTEGYMLRITAQSALAELLRRTKLIVWDEAPMMVSPPPLPPGPHDQHTPALSPHRCAQHKYHLDALDKTLQSIMGNTLPFGGKVVVMGGDFRQCLAIVKRAGKLGILEATLKEAKAWRHVQEFELKENMRVLSSGGEDGARLSDWADYLLSVGDGADSRRRTPTMEYAMELSSTICLEASRASDAQAQEASDIRALGAYVYPGIESGCTAHIAELGEAEELGPVAAGREFFARRAILAPYNQDVANINAQLASSFPGDMGAPPPREYATTVGTPGSRAST
jgi:ATP-dependent DNA helicase PIF1